jgi:hypothetical protein
MTEWHRLAYLAAAGLVSDHRERRRLTGRPPTRRSLRSLDPRLHRPVFVVGAPRSGTTFLGSRLGLAGGFSYHFEPRLTKAVARHVHDGTWPERTAAAVFRANHRALLLAGLHGGLRFAEKNPENCFILPFLDRAFPGSVYVHIVRDGRDAAVSLAEKPWLAAAEAGSGRRGRGGQRWGPYPRFWVEPARRAEFAAVSDVERAAWCWRRFTGAALEGLAGLPADRVLTVRYEEMVTAPSATARELADFLGVPGGDRTALERAFAAADPGSVGRWRQRLDATGRADVRRQAGPLLDRLGYADA